MKIIMTIQMIMMIKGRYQSCVLFTDSQNSCLCFLDLFKGSFHELQRKLEVLSTVMMVLQVMIMVMMLLVILIVVIRVCDGATLIMMLVID